MPTPATLLILLHSCGSLLLPPMMSPSRVAAPLFSLPPPMMTPSTAMLQLMSPLARRACLARARAAPLAAASASDAAAKGCQRLKPTVEIVIKESGHSYEEKDELVLKCSHGGISFEVPLIVDTVSCGIQRAAAVLSRFDTAPLPSLTCLPRRLTGTRRTCIYSVSTCVTATGRSSR